MKFRREDLIIKEEDCHSRFTPSQGQMGHHPEARISFLVSS
jgi:hypothetical protein